MIVITHKNFKVGLKRKTDSYFRTVGLNSELVRYSNGSKLFDHEWSGIQAMA